MVLYTLYDELGWRMSLAPRATSAVLFAHTQAQTLREQLLQHADALLVACYCADWCRTCAAYYHDFEALAQRFPQYVFVWIDIEESPQLLDDADVENFPTLRLEQQDQTLFFGVQQPLIHQLESLLQRLDRLVPIPGLRALRPLLAA